MSLKVSFPETVRFWLKANSFVHRFFIKFYRNRVKQINAKQKPTNYNPRAHGDKKLFRKRKESGDPIDSIAPLYNRVWSI